MADPISGVAGQALSQGIGGEKLRQQGGAPGGGQSFENVLQRTQGGGGTDPTQQTHGVQGAGAPKRAVSGAKLEEMRLDLMKRVDRLPPGAGNVNALLPELLDSRTRMGMLREVLNSRGAQGGGTPGGGTPGGKDLTGRFGQVENEWKEVESIMRSNKDLSTTELLGLQARLYQVSQHVEVLSKVVDQVTGGIKTILNTNV